MIRSRLSVVRANFQLVGVFQLCLHCLTTAESMVDERGSPVSPDIWKEGFELLANARKVSINGVGFDMVGHVYGEE